jgi:hypothetical protein
MVSLMTAQVADTLVYEGRDYRIAAIENDWPFTPQDHGLEPRGQDTACRRGYFCRYSVTDGALFLMRLNVATAPAEPKPWRGIQPKEGEFFKFDRTWVYDGLQLPVAYSGGVIVGCDFLREYYVHMGFQRPHCYRTVIELVFEAGRLKRVRDYSEEMERVRQRIRAHQGTSAPTPSRQDIEQFVDEAFSLSYDKKWLL